MVNNMKRYSTSLVIRKNTKYCTSTRISTLIFIDSRYNFCFRNGKLEVQRLPYLRLRGKILTQDLVPTSGS